MSQPKGPGWAAWETQEGSPLVKWVGLPEMPFERGSAYRRLPVIAFAVVVAPASPTHLVISQVCALLSTFGLSWGCGWGSAGEERDRRWPWGRSVGTGDGAQPGNPKATPVWSGRNDKAQLAESPGPQRVGMTGPSGFPQGPGSSAEKYLSSAQLGTVIPSPRLGSRDTPQSVGAGTVQHVIYFPGSNVFFFSFMKEFPVKPPPVIHVGCVPAVQNLIDVSSHD